ncbi:unnamed protein product [Effrenium voratum]|nr:unnamed protein product [Effrenium voratum]
MAPPELRDLLQSAPQWRKKDVDSIEARLSRVGVTTCAELRFALRSKTLAESLQRSGKPLTPDTLRTLEQLADAGEVSHEDPVKEFPRMHGLSHIRRSPRWTFKQSTDLERRFLPPGPGAYHSDTPEWSSRYQKGPVFSFGLSGRDPVGKQKIPGPGAYELAKEAGQGTASWTMTARRAGHGADGEVPGPGDYELQASLGKSPRYTAGKKFDMGAQKERPGPGDYFQGEVGAKTPSWRFGTSSRPSNGLGQLATPGPGAYMVASTAPRQQQQEWQ